MTLVKADAKPTIGSEVVEKNPTINVELLRSVMEYIKAHPTTWNQDSWFHVIDRDGNVVPHLVTVTYEEINSCDTAFCFAGHAALVEGFPNPPKDNYLSWDRFVSDDDGYEIEGKGRGRMEGVDEYAAKRLGLDYDVAEELFDAANTMEDLEEMVKFLEECAENGVTPSWSDLADIRDRDYEDDYYGEDDE